MSTLADTPPQPPAIAHASLAAVAADWITTRIIEGRINPGEKLTEVGLAEQMGVSRSPVREALRALSREGLIKIEPRRGAFVADLDGADAADLYACRLLLEPECTRLSVEVIDDQRVDMLSELFAAMRAAVAEHEPSAYVAALKRYHLTLLDGCPNRILFGFAESSWRSTLRYWNLTVRSSQNYLDKSLRRNRGLHTAVQARDGKVAAQVSTDILVMGRGELLKVLSRLPGGGVR